MFHNFVLPVIRDQKWIDVILPFFSQRFNLKAEKTWISPGGR